MRDARYIDIPGNGTHELPPLLLNALADHAPSEEAPDLASVMPEAEDMLAASDATEEVLERRKFELHRERLRCGGEKNFVGAESGCGNDQFGIRRGGLGGIQLKRAVDTG